MTCKFIKALLPKFAKNRINNFIIGTNQLIINRKIAKQLPFSGSIDYFEYKIFKNEVISFIESLQVSDTEFLYSKCCDFPTLYSSAYACMALNFLGELPSLGREEKTNWVNYFDSFQSPEDGLWYDPIIKDSQFIDSDWWGTRHLALHMICAYTDLGSQPKYRFSFLDQYYNYDFIENWLNTFDWFSPNIGKTDIDNKLMNIVCLLQYSRDTWNDKQADNTIKQIKQYLLNKINTNTGIWGGDINDQEQLSRMIQFAYHIFAIFFYDDYFGFDHEKIINLTLQTQNKFGGFGCKANSSACEDIDSIDILIRLRPYANDAQKSHIDNSLKNAWKWIFQNQVEDGGFVFKLHERMQYGHKQMSSRSNCGAMFPTWFRLLSIAYIYNTYRDPQFLINKSPGLIY